MTKGLLRVKVFWQNFDLSVFFVMGNVLIRQPKCVFILLLAMSKSHD